MSAKNLQSIKRKLDCPVCFEEYNHITKIPKTLRCGHTVCVDCLKNILRGNHIQCPICRKSYLSIIDDLPTCFIALSIVDSMCQDCRNALKTDQCLSGHCNQELCDPCRGRHLQAFQPDYQQAFSALQSEITQLEVPCSDVIEGLNRMIDKQNKVIEQVNNTCDGLKDQIEKIRTMTIQEIKAKVERTTNSILQWQNNLREGLDEGKKIVEHSKNLSFMNGDLYTRCETLRKELGEKSQQMPSFIDCSLITSFSDITTLLPDRLDVSYSTVTKTIGSPNRGCSLVKSEISIIEDYRAYTGCVVYKGKAPWDISVSQSTGIIAFTEDTSLQIMSDQFEALTSYSGEGSVAGKMKHASGIVISKDNKIFVSDRLSHNIHVSDVTGRHLFLIGSEGGDQGQFKRPRGLAMDEDDTLFVCDCGNHRICCFTSDGSFIRQFGSKNDKHPFTSALRFIAASRLQDKVVVSDYKGNLYFFSHGGHYQGMISMNRAAKAPYNIKARGLVIDRAGRTIVSDGRGGQLLVLDDNLQVVARMGSKEQLIEPHGVTLTARGDLLVCDYWNNRIQIFSSKHN